MSVTTGQTIKTSMTGVVVANGTSVPTAHTVSQYSVVVAGASNAPTGVAPSTAGQVFKSTGASSNPAFQNMADAATTWTPTLAFGGASVGITYSSRYAYYVHLSGMVFYHLYFLLTNKGSSVGAATITGLVVASGANSNLQSAPISNYSVLSLTANYTTPYVTIGNASTTLALRQSAPNGSASIVIDDTMFANNSELSISGFYITD